MIRREYIYLCLMIIAFLISKPILAAVNEYRERPEILRANPVRELAGFLWLSPKYEVAYKDCEGIKDSMPEMFFDRIRKTRQFRGGYVFPAKNDADAERRSTSVGPECTVLFLNKVNLRSVRSSVRIGRGRKMRLTIDHTLICEPEYCFVPDYRAN